MNFRWNYLAAPAALAVCLALFASRAQAAPVPISFGFDADGSLNYDGGADEASVELGSFDWKVGNALAVGGNTAIGAFAAFGVQIPFELFYQASLAAILDADGETVFGTSVTSGLNQLTIVAGFTEVVTSVTGTPGGGSATFALAPVQTVNYLQIYWDDTPDASDLAGTGFNNTTGPVVSAPDPDAKLILDATVDQIFASNFEAKTPIRNLDSFGGDSYPTIDSVTGSGATTLSASIKSYDPTFFDFGAFPTNLIVSLFNSSQILPFDQTNPSAAFLTTSTTTTAGLSPVTAGAGIGVASLGTINGAAIGSGGGPDVQFQVDGSSSFAVVPEPASLLLFSLGAMGLGLCASRRRRIA